MQKIAVAQPISALVSFYSSNLYVSKNLDLLDVAFTRQAKLRKAGFGRMAKKGWLALSLAP